MEGQATASTTSIKPQEVVHLKDTCSVVSGVSLGEFSDGGQGSGVTTAAAAAGLFMSPTGKASRKVKKKVTKKKKSTSSSAIPTMTKESGPTAADDDTAKAAKSGKVKVINKKMKSPVVVKDAKPVEIPDASNSNESEETKGSKTTVSDSARKLSTKKPERNHSSPVKLSEHFGKDAAQDLVSALEERSVKTSASKKKKKRSESFTAAALSPGSTEGEGRRARTGSTKKERRSRSKSSDRTRSRSKSSERTRSDDDASISRPKRTGKKKSSIKTTDTPDESTAELNNLRKDNQEMLEEIEFLRQQMNEVGEDGLSRVEVEQIKMDLKLALSESREMKQEIEDYEESMVEKDILIKKLTDAVDAQLDKVEHLELKLLRAEEEFCNMEDELKECEDVIETMQCAAQEKSSARPNQDLLEQEKTLERERLRLQEWENELKECENDLHTERRLENERRKLDLKYSSHSNEGNEAEGAKSVIEELKTKLAETEAQNAELQEENDRLSQYTKERHEKEQEQQERRDDEIRTIQIGINKQLQELDDENESLRRRIETVNEEKKSSQEKFEEQIADMRKENTRLNERIGLASQRPGTDGEGPSVDYVCELEEEIADLREKMVEHEDHSRRQKEEIARVFVENEDIKQDLQERETELRDLETQFAESKEASGKKMKQKDETISFMQTEMMRIMQEKQKVDRILREKKLDATENDLMSSNHRKGVDEEAEKAKLEAINEQLRQLDDENRTLEEKLTDLQYNHSMRLKEKQAIILDLQEELNDAKWELGARKEGADYITLLKDRKERKRQLDKARKELKKSEERIMDLESENANLTNVKQDLEKEIASLNKNVDSMDSGEYVSGLKRQIKSLKQHNSALERKLQVEAREADEKLRLQEAKIRILEHDVEKLQNPTRTAIKSVFANFAKKEGDTEDTNDLEGTTVQRDTGKEEKSELQKERSLSSVRETNDNGETRSTRIWNLFSPRRSAQRSVVASGFHRLDVDLDGMANDAQADPADAKSDANGRDVEPESEKQEAAHGGKDQLNETESCEDPVAVLDDNERDEQASNGIEDDCESTPVVADTEEKLPENCNDAVEDAIDESKATSILNGKVEEETAHDEDDVVISESDIADGRDNLANDDASDSADALPALSSQNDDDSVSNDCDFDFCQPETAET
ncbi:MAG: hypothetical protein SGILL_001483 [Bacillariaceae sp.]